TAWRFVIDEASGLATGQRYLDV
ncbi:MAG: hypothetical protein QOF95_255, partial [Pseudonocardiales bacterium]|nr:hypothetical protein [Pseudonocardiales bacterium]